MRSLILTSLAARHLTTVILLGVVTACGGAPTAGDGPNPPGPVTPPPIASLAVTPSSATLVAGQTVTLAATARDAAGATLTGRAITFVSSAPAVATVSASGAVTAIATGTTTITASGEGQSASAAITVTDGAMVGPAGGTITLAGGAVVLTIPAGALPTATPITATPRTGPAPEAPSGWQLAGAFYDLGPDGLTFAQPATVTMTFDKQALPAWGMTGDLGILRQHAGQWSTLSNVHVNVEAGTISGTTTGFSGFGVGANDPPITVSPATASVNDAHRTRQLRALVAPRGEGIPRAGPGVALRYRWRTDGQAGVLSGVTPNTWTTSDSASYIATDPALRQKTGRIDVVYLDVLLNPESLTNTALPQRVYTVQVPVDADLALTYDITPSLPRIDAGTTGTLRMTPRDRQGVALAFAPNQTVTWQSTAEFGTLNASTQGARDQATFTAASQFSAPPPRVDRVIATVRESNTHDVRTLSGVQVGGTSFYRTEQITTTSVRGVDTAFVEVFVDYRVSLTPATRTLKPFESVTMNVQLTPAYNGPGLKYRFRKTGSNGALNVPLTTLTDATSITYEANASGDGTDVVQVDVVSVVAGTEVAQLGTGESRLTVDKMLLRPVWRITSMTLIEDPGYCGIVCPNPYGPYAGVGNVVQSPQDYLLHVFTAPTPDLVPFSQFAQAPAVMIQQSLPEEEAKLHPPGGSRRVFLVAGNPDPTGINGVFASHSGTASLTGSVVNGTVSGQRESLVTLSQILEFYSIQATISGKTLTGTIRRRYRNTWSLPANPIDKVWVYRVVAELVTQ